MSNISNVSDSSHSLNTSVARLRRVPLLSYCTERGIRANSLTGKDHWVFNTPRVDYSRIQTATGASQDLASLLLPSSPQLLFQPTYLLLLAHDPFPALKLLPRICISSPTAWLHGLHVSCQSFQLLALIPNGLILCLEHRFDVCQV